MGTSAGRAGVLVALATLAGVGQGVGCGGAAPALEFPETARVARETQKNESGVEVLLAESHYVLDGAGGFVNTWHQRYRVLDGRGVEGWSSVEASYSPWFMAPPTIEVKVTAPNGETAVLDPKLLSEAPQYPDAPDSYSDARVLRGPLPRIEVGAVVDEVIVTRTTKPFFGDGYLHQELVRGSVPRQRVEVVVEAPATSPLRFELRDADIHVEDTTEGAVRRLRFEGGPYAAIEGPPPMMPSDAPAWPHIAFSSGASWQSLATSYARLVEERLPVSALADAAEKAVGEADSPRAKADALLAWLRKRVRYVGVELGESAIVPRDPLATLKNAYGDCKDQATLLVTLLRAVDVPAHVALLRAGTGEDVRPELPALNGFNHAIVVTDTEPPVWVDPTAPYARAGELPVGDGDRLALVIDEDTTALVRTPAPKVEEHRYEEVRSVHFADTGPVRVVEVSTATGHIEQQLRGELAGAEETLRDNLDKYVVRQYRAPRLTRFERSTADELARPVSLRVEAEKAQFGASTLLDATAFLDPNMVFRWVPGPFFDEESKSRAVDLVLTTPYEAEVRYELHPPVGFALAAPLAERRVALGPATYTRIARTRPDGVLEVNHTFRLPKRRLAPAELEQFRVAYAKLGLAEEERVELLHESERLRRARNGKGALASLLAGVAAQPKSAVAHLRLAWMASELGFGETARSHARAAVLLDGSQSTFWLYQGDILRRDLQGRHDQRGWDRAGAIEAYRRAAALDPKSVIPALVLSQVLETDERGGRYAPGAELVEAAAVLDAVDPEALRAHESGAFVDNVLYDLLWAGRYEEVESRLTQRPPAERPLIVAASAAAMRRGVDAGIAEIEQRGLAAAERTTALAGLGDTLTRLRRYPEAAQVSELAVASSTSPELLAHARLRAKLRRLDFAKLPMGTPVDVAASVFALGSLDPSGKKALLAPLLSPRARDGGADLRSVQLFAEEGLSGGLPPEAFGELAWFQLKDASSLSGDDTAGYQVTFQLKPDNRPIHVYVTREPEGYRVRSFGAPAELGCEALRLAKAGDLRGAKRWLEWVEARRREPDFPPMALSVLALWTTTHDVTLAATSLCACGPEARAMLPELERLHAAASPAQRDVYALGRVSAFAYALQLDKLVEVGVELEKSPTMAEAGRAWSFGALHLLGRAEALRAKADAALRAEPEDRLAKTMLARALVALGRRDEGLALMEEARVAAGDTVPAYNEQAWLACEADHVRPVELAAARRSVELAPDSVVGLNILAMTYAVLGRVDDARETLARVLEQRALKQPETADWLVIGRMAEAAGLRDEARLAYERAARVDTFELRAARAFAERRLALLARTAK